MINVFQPSMGEEELIAIRQVFQWNLPVTSWPFTS